MIKIKKEGWTPYPRGRYKGTSGSLKDCSMFATSMALNGSFKDFMTHSSGRCTPMGMEKIRLEQDVSFGIGDINMH